MKKVAVLLAVLMLLAAVCSGCVTQTPTATESGNTTAAAPAAGGADAAAPDAEASAKDTVTVVISSDVGTLSPFELNSAAMKRMARPILETLTTYDAEGNLVLLLIDSYEYDTDSMGVTIHLKQGVKFHNGEELKAEDVLFTFQGYANGNTKSDVSKIDVANCKIIDDYTLYVPAANGIANATLLDYFKNIQIVNKKFMESGVSTSTQMVGTGPYKLMEYVTGDHLTYAAFDEYHGGVGKTKTLIHRFISEAATAMIELEGGNVDMIMDPLTADIERVDSGATEGLKTITGPYYNLYFVAFNNGEGLCSDIRVRQAVAYATNKEDIRIAAFNEYSQVHNSMVPRASVGYSDEFDKNTYEYDVEKAKSLLAEAGVAEGTELTLMIDGGAYYAAIADQMIYQLNKVGIKVNMVQYDTATVNETLFNTNDWDMVLRNYTSIGEPMASLDLYGQAGLSKIGGSVCTRLYDDEKAWELTELLNTAVTKSDDAERIAVYYDIQKLWDANLWCLPLVCRTAVGLATDNMEGAYTLGSAVYDQFAYVTAD